MHLTGRLVVAIDGPAGAGKSTVARRIAARLGFTYIDTGAMYRAVALWALRTGIDPADAHRLEPLAWAAEIELGTGNAQVWLNGEDVSEAIRAPELSAAASQVSVVPGVRRALVAKQRRMAEHSSVVMEGRDIGTVVFPDAGIKIFLDADPSERARRRSAELRERGLPQDATEVEREIHERDRRDRSRADSPLMQAPDAVYLDTTRLTLEEVEETILKLIRDRTANGKEIQR